MGRDKDVAEIVGNFGERLVFAKPVPSAQCSSSSACMSGKKALLKTLSFLRRSLKREIACWQAGVVVRHLSGQWPFVAFRQATLFPGV